MRALGLLGVLPILPIGIVAYGIGDETTQHPVAARHLGWKTRHWYRDVHVLGILLREDPRLHASHRVPDDHPEVLHVEVLRQQAMMRDDHVVVVVSRKFGTQAVGWLRRLAVPERVGNDEEVAARIERLAPSEELPGEGG